MKKLLTLCMLLCTVFTGAWATVTETQVTDLSTISSEKYYIIKHSNRGTLVVADGYNNMLLQGATVSGSNSNCTVAVTFDKSLWKITKDGDKYTIQSYANSKYVGSTRNLSSDAVSLSIVSTGSSNTYYIKNGDNYLCFWPGYAWNSTSGGPVAYKNSADGSDFSIIEVSDTEIESIRSAINTIYPNNGKVGYPDMSSLENYKDGNVNIFNSTTAKSALNDVYASTSVNLPESGKAYRIYNVTKNGTKRVVYYDGTTLKITSNGTTEVPTGKEGVFICGQDGQKFFFTNNSGKYFRVSSSDKNKAASDSYGEIVNDNNVNALTISKMATVNSCTDAQRFGLLMIKGYADFSGANGEHYLMGSNAQNFVQGAAGLQMFTDAAQSIGFLFEEVENPNKVVLTKPNSSFEGGLNQKFVGTFSAPYNVELPEGVKAYTATQNGTTINFSLLGDGSLVPKNTGVLVYAESAETPISEGAIPAAAPMPSMDGVDNLLHGTNGSSANVSTDVNAYILASTNEDGVLFYKLSSENALSRIVNRNKAYLVLPAGSPVSAFRFDFEEQTTGIESVESIAPAKSAFDLSGRSVKANQRGLYIVEGKKVIR